MGVNISKNWESASILTSSAYTIPLSAKDLLSPYLGLRPAERPEPLGHWPRLGRCNTPKLFFPQEEGVAIPEWLTLAEGVRLHPLTETTVVPGTLNRLIGMLSVVTEELPDCPLYFQSDRLCAALRTPVPKIALIRSALLNAGYRVSFSHAALSSIKTDAPMSFIWDIMCAWKRKYEAETKARDSLRSSTPPPLLEEGNDEMGNGGKAKKQKKHGKKHPPSEAALRVVDRLMARPPNPMVSFEAHPDANPPSRASGLLRYQMNPEPNWGPKARPSRNAKSHDADKAVTSPQLKKLRTLD
ncbi:tRNA guanine 26 N 2 dimethyltransferase [Taenia crassiceps]|uniref:tRNA (guanine(26)-N(2))-dimethyltransferase n=1 Tax=Taenia crassiceps TaxID=6207 RepID=A0ABR4QJH8_9CEST